jgi:hypothetical protein
MKKEIKFLFVLFSMLFSFTAANANNVSILNDTINERLSKVVVSAPAKIRLVKSDTTSIRIITEDDEVMRNLRYNVRNGMLNIQLLGDEILDNNIGIIITTKETTLPVVYAGRDYEIIERNNKRAKLND